MAFSTIDERRRTKMSSQPDEPIKIQWDDLKSRKVDQRLKEHEAVERNRRQAEMNPLTTTADAPTKSSIWFNSVFVMTLFGLLGGLLAWGGGEAIRLQSNAQPIAAREQAMNEFMRRKAESTADLNSANLLVEKLNGETPVDQKAVDVQTERIHADTKAADDAGRGIDELKRENPDDPMFAIKFDPTLSSAQRDAKLGEIQNERKLKQNIAEMLRFGLSGLLIAACLSIAEPLVERNFGGAILYGIVGAASGLIGGLVVALFVEKLYHALIGGQDTDTGTSATIILARAVSWGVLGLFLTLGPGLVMRNIKKMTIGMLGGLIGGLIGGALYDPIFTASGSDDLGRLVALIAIGLFAGLGTGLIENAAKNGWLKVTAGLIAGKQFILYRNPTFIGSGPECPIYLFRDAQVGKRHAAIHIVPGGFELENLPLGSDTNINGKPITRARLRSGDQIQVGITSFTFQEKTKKT